MTAVVEHGRLSFSPSRAAVERSQLTAFIRYCESETGRHFPDQQSFHHFSVTEFRLFWSLFLCWAGPLYEGAAEPVCVGDEVEHAQFFPELRLNYVENLLVAAPGSPDATAVIAHHGDGSRTDLTRRELTRQVIAVATAFEQHGLGVGDRVVAISANTEQLIVAGLAAMSLGATLSSAAPDMGVDSVLARFAPLSPSLLLVGVGSAPVVSTEQGPGNVEQILAGLPSLTAVVLLDDQTLPDAPVPVLRLAALLDDFGHSVDPETFEWRRLPFNHPLMILFSSGTTGPPKCIVHSAGGVLLEHLKEHRLHGDLSSEDTLFFHTSPAWMMWNWQLSALAVGAAIVLYDGPVTRPSTLWSIVDAAQVTVFGTSPAYLQLCEDAGFRPRAEYPLSDLRLLMSTGSILHDRQFDWVIDNVGYLPVHSISGGTDIVGCFVLGNPNLPVRRGESQVRSLGLDVRSLVSGPGPVGELICTNPFPSRPLGLYGDVAGRRFHEAYFAEHPGVWTHGDLIEITPQGSARMHGRSDGVLNIGGMRIGPAEIYRIVNDLGGVREALAVEQVSDDALEPSRIVLLVVMSTPGTLDSAFERRIRHALAAGASPAHVPQLIAEVTDLPRTFSGKGSERSVRDVLNGAEVANLQAVRNPESLLALQHAVAAADERHRRQTADAELVDGDDVVGGLCAIFADILHVSPVGPDDDFFDLGGTSLAIAYLCQTIERRTGHDVAMSTVFAAPSPRALAARLRTPRDDMPDLVVELEPGHAGARPVFALHDVHGDVLAYLKLARMLPGERPVYGIRARGLDGDFAPDETVEEMAETAIEGLRRVQPTGPYTLIGYSFGGLVAFEMARRLRACGDEVDLVGLLDTYVSPRCLSRYERLAFHAVHRPVQWLRWAWGGGTQRVVERAGRVAARLAPQLAKSSEPRRLPATPRRAAVALAARRELKRHRPGQYDGRVAFFRAEGRLPNEADPVRFWRRMVTGDLSVIPVPAGHFGMVAEPDVAVLADALAPLLAARPSNSRLPEQYLPA